MGARILIADDHKMLRDGLRSLIESQPGMEVVGEASDMRETSWQAQNLDPDVILMDLSMPGGAAVPTIKSILENKPHIRILVLTMHDDPAFLRSALAAGAAGYVLKKSAYSQLLEALAAVGSGRVFVDPCLPLDGVVAGAKLEAPRALSPREREVLVLLARGATYKQVAERLHMGDRTVETHRRRIGEKLGLKSRADLVRYALEFGLLGPGDIGRDDDAVS
jgi:two-component system, NarL family, response regulator NreC